MIDRDILLTESQLNAIKSFESFLNSDKQVFFLKGAAGTGKTTLLKEFLKICNSRYLPTKLMAPTGRASSILHQRTNQQAQTIHSAIYKEEDDSDYMNNITRFVIRNNTDSQRMVYFVDEASMISDIKILDEFLIFGSGRLLSDLMQFCGKRKIVFIGDHAQLHPIGMAFSPALEENYIYEKFGCSGDSVVLTEVIRQLDTSSILKNATFLRHQLEQQQFNKFKIENASDTLQTPEGILTTFFQNAKDKPSSNQIIITYSNKMALEYNTEVRRHYYPNKLKSINHGEFLIVARNNYAVKPNLFNGSFVKVEGTIDENQQIHRNIKIKNNNIQSIDLVWRPITITYRSNNDIIRQNILLLENSLTDTNACLDPLVNQALVIDFNMRNRHLDRATYRELMKSDPYLNALVVKYGYAITGHKAQGGEWPTAFVDFSRTGGKSNDEYFRWCYTAITRASSKLYYSNAPSFDCLSRINIREIGQGGKFIPYRTQEDGDNFLETRFEHIKLVAQDLNITVSENRTYQYEHRLVFTNRIGENATIILWYKSSGYSGKIKVITSSSKDFENKCINIIETPLHIEPVLNIRETDSAQYLHEKVSCIASDLGISIENVTHEQYCDKYHLRTSGKAVVGFYFNLKGQYTDMHPQSSIGENDLMLKEFCNVFKNEL